MIEKAESNKTIKPIKPISVNPQLSDTSAGDYLPMAGLFQRFTAFLVDILLMVGIGQVFALAFAAPLSEIGPYGRPLGLLIVLPYFGILNSEIGNGQTLGKRLFKIAVRGSDNLPISIWWSLLRITILITPIFFYGLSIPELNSDIFSLLASVLIFGLSGSILYTMLFNRDAKQGIHDMLLKTYVVDLRGKPQANFPETGKRQWITSAIWLGITIIFFSFLVMVKPNPESAVPYDAMATFNKVINAQPDVLTSSVFHQTTQDAEKNQSSTLIVSIWLKGQRTQSDYEQEVPKMAAFVLDNFKDLDGFETMQVGVLSGFDIGIAGRTSYYSLIYTFDEWQKLLSEK
jgi:uncharacterized RDD family membrane protein YckC